MDGSPADAVKCGPGSDVAQGLAVPGAYGDCEWVFSSSAESPYLTVSDIRLRRHRHRVMSDSRSAVRRDARLPRAGTCAKKKR